MVLRGGQPEPVERFREVLLHAEAVGEHVAVVVLRVRIALPCGGQEPAQGLLEVLLDALAHGIDIAELGLRLGIAGLGARHERRVLGMACREREQCRQDDGKWLFKKGFHVYMRP